MGVLILSAGLIPAVLLIVIGLLIKYKKAYWLISGYSTMSSEKKKNVDIEGLGRFTGNVCFAIAAVILAAFIFLALGKWIATLAVFTLLLPLIIYTLIKAQSFDGNTRDSEGKMKTGTKVLIGSIIAVLILTAVGVGILLHFSSIPAEYTMQNGILKISGMYGQEVPISKISSLELKNTLPEVITRTNGSALDTMLKGHFRIKDIGEAKLFVDVSKPPFIFLKSNSKVIIINCEESNKTKELYERLSEEWKSSAGK